MKCDMLNGALLVCESRACGHPPICKTPFQIRLCYFVKERWWSVSFTYIFMCICTLYVHIYTCIYTYVNTWSMTISDWFLCWLIPCHDTHGWFVWNWKDCLGWHRRLRWHKHQPRSTRCQMAYGRCSRHWLEKHWERNLPISSRSLNCSLMNCNVIDHNVGFKLPAACIPVQIDLYGRHAFHLKFHVSPRGDLSASPPPPFPLLSQSPWKGFSWLGYTPLPQMLLTRTAVPLVCPLWNLKFARCFTPKVSHGLEFMKEV